MVQTLVAVANQLVVQVQVVTVAVPLPELVAVDLLDATVAVLLLQLAVAIQLVHLRKSADCLANCLAVAAEAAAVTADVPVAVAVPAQLAVAKQPDVQVAAVQAAADAAY